MPQEYKITRVSAEQPRVHEGSYGTTYYIKVALEGVDKPVTIGKKRPDALKVGDTVYGRIVSTQYDTDKFQAEQNPNRPGSAPASKDQDTIKAQFAIKTAVAVLGENKSGTYDDYLADVETYAKKFFSMVDRVKVPASDPLAAARAIFKPEAQAPQPTANANSVAKGMDPVYDPTDEPIDLNDIPF